jgi:hypothetical protein
MGKSQRDKGKRGERECVNWIKEIYPDARRSANQSGGAAQPDVDGTPYWVECKSGKSIGLWAALKQAMEDRKLAKDPRPCMLYLARTNGERVIVMRAEDFMDECLRR